jgi:YbbR domain-containing protein
MDRFLNNNTVLRIMALVLSFILWFAVNAPSPDTGNNQAGVQEKWKAPVHVLTNSDMATTSISDPTVTIVVDGATYSGVLSGEMLNVAVTADARGLTPGKHILRLSATNMPLLTYHIVPATVSVTLARKVKMDKPVAVQVTGTPKTGYVVGTPSSDARNVSVSGIQEAVNEVDHVVATVSVQGSATTVTKNATLRAVDKRGKQVPGIQIDPVETSVTVPIQPPQVTVNVTPQVMGVPAAGYAVSGVSVSPSTVLAYGTPAVTSQLKNVGVPIDVSGMRSDQTVSAHVPTAKGISKLTPDTVKVVVHVESALSKTLANVPISILNTPANETVTLTGQKTVSVIVTGPRSIVSGLQTGDIQVNVDATNLTSTDTRAVLTVLLPKWVRVAQISTPTVSVQVAGG